MGRWIDIVSPNAVRPQSGKITVPSHMPPYGRHTRQILARLGYDRAAIDSMIQAGIAGEGWSEKYLPE